MIVDSTDTDADPDAVEYALARTLNESDDEDEEEVQIDPDTVAYAESPEWWLAYETDVSLLKRLYLSVTNPDDRFVIQKRLHALDAATPAGDRTQATLGDL